MAEAFYQAGLVVGAEAKLSNPFSTWQTSTHFGGATLKQVCRADDAGMFLRCALGGVELVSVCA
jgi:hypothetical protein